MTHELLSLAGIVAALAIGVVSPGPSFVMVAREAVAASRAQAVGAALGMGVGGLLFAVAALLGLQAVFHAVPALYVGLKVLGGAYLAYLGLRVLRAAREPLPTGDAAPQRGRARRSFWLGLTTQVSNPKTAIVYASVFAAFLPAQVSPGFVAVLLVLVFAVEAGWYAVVGLVLSAAGPRKAYLSAKAWVDRAAGLVMCGLGLRLMFTAARP